jgi:hypothetical protein
MTTNWRDEAEKMWKEYLKQETPFKESKLLIEEAMEHAATIAKAELLKGAVRGYYSEAEGDFTDYVDMPEESNYRPAALIFVED